MRLVTYLKNQKSVGIKTHRMVRYLQLQAKERAVVVAMGEFICVLILGIRTIWLCVRVSFEMVFYRKNNGILGWWWWLLWLLLRHEMRSTKS